MNEEVRELLEGELKRVFRELDDLYPGCEDYNKIVENLSELYKLKIEETKNDCDYSERYNRRVMEDNHHKIDTDLKKEQWSGENVIREREDTFKTKQLVEETKSRYFRLGVETAGIVLPLLFYATWMKKGLKFEETGTFTSTTFRGLVQKFKPVK